MKTHSCANWTLPGKSLPYLLIVTAALSACGAFDGEFIDDEVFEEEAGQSETKSEVLAGGPFFLWTCAFRGVNHHFSIRMDVNRDLPVDSRSQRHVVGYSSRPVA